MMHSTQNTKTEYANSGFNKDQRAILFSGLFGSFLVFSLFVLIITSSSSAMLDARPYMIDFINYFCMTPNCR